MRRRSDLEAVPASLGLAVDEALLESVRRGGEAMVRFWIGERAVVIGRSQRIEDEVDLPVARQDGVLIFRRCSGGGAVLHYPGNLNVSVVVGGVGSVGEVFQRLGGAVADALREMGVDARVRGSAIMERFGKLSGAAQARRGRAVLYHGTLLLEPDVVPMQRYLLALRAGYAPARVPSRPQPTTTLSESLGRKVTAAEVAAAVGLALSRILGEPGGGDTLTAEELASAETLRRSRYEDSTWTMRG